MVEEAKKGSLWSNDEFIKLQHLSGANNDRLNRIGDLVQFWEQKKDALQRLIVKKNLPFKWVIKSLS